MLDSHVFHSIPAFQHSSERTVKLPITATAVNVVFLPYPLKIRNAVKPELVEKITALARKEHPAEKIALLIKKANS